jgi:hypothetical protein
MFKAAVRSAALLFPLLKLGGTISVRVVEKYLPSFPAFGDGGIRAIAADIPTCP